MKRITRILAVALIAITGFSLTLSAAEPKEKCIKKLEKLNKEVKKEAANFTDEDWDAVLEQYNAISEELKTYEYTEEELRYIGKQKGRFLGMVAKKSLTKGSKQLNEFLQQMGGFLEGLLEGGGGDDE